MVNVSVSLDEKRKKLAYEYSKDKPNKVIINRLKDAIRRHEKDMKRYNNWKRRYKRRHKR